MQAPEFWHRGGPLAALLAPLGWLYGLGGDIRQTFARPHRAGVPVICIGNLVAGGAGKTPVALAVAEMLWSMGVSPAFVSRGYGGSAQGPLKVEPDRHGPELVGDEPLLLARFAPTWVARHRPAGVLAAEAAGCGAIILDDGFQNPGVDKDLSLVVVDGGYGFGNGRVMPAGPLREPVRTGLQRAHAVVVLGDDATGAARHARDLPVLHARLEPLPGQAEKLAGERVVAFAGIGRPEKFFTTLRQLGADLLATHAYPDHHPYERSELERLVSQARALDARLVTTEKDLVRVPCDLRAQMQALLVGVRWDSETVLKALLAGAVRP